MGHYEERLEQDLNHIRAEVAHIGEWVEKALSNALRAVLTLDTRLAYETILGDKRINRAVQRLDRHCHYFVARHLPSAGHLRFISSVLRINIELERVGDYATTMCREAAQFSKPLDLTLKREVERMGKNATSMFHQALKAFDESNAELAKATMYGDLIERSFAAAFEELVKQSEANTRSEKDEFATLVIFNMLERVGDQAVNICEETVFAVTGEQQQLKVYRIIFLDKTNGSLGPMAQSIARKGYPKGGKYYTAGISPDEDFDPQLRSFMEDHGNSLPEAPRAIDWVPEAWNDYYVIVALEGKIEDYLAHVPFRTIAFEWDLDAPAREGMSEADHRGAIEASYKELASRIRGLMESLHGDDAS